MKIYFSGAISQKDQYGKAYEKIVALLEREGHEVFQDTTLVSLEEAINKTDEQRVAYYKLVLKWITQTDLSVFEVSFPSTLNIGHEMSLALEKGKPVIALYQQGKEPSFFLGREDEKLIWSDYNINNISSTLPDLIRLANDVSDTRFNFFLSKKNMKFLDSESEKKKIPKSVLLRKLITADMENNREFSS